MRLANYIVIAATPISMVVGCAPHAHRPTTAPSAAVAMAPLPIATFGPDQTIPDSQAIPVDKVIAAPETYAEKHVKISGLVGSVCPTKGCWLRVVPEPGHGIGNVFVKFRDPPEGRLIPLEAVGREITVEGTLKNGKISEAQAKHLAQDAGASQEEVDKIVGPQPQLSVGTPAVAIEGVSR